MKKLLLYLLCFSTTNILAVENKSYQSQFNRCSLSKATLNNYEPEQFQPINNLLRKTGQNTIYRGTKIIIKGRILDQNCVPVSDAKIYLWQVGYDGKYPYIPLRTRIDTNKLNLSNSLSFTGSGTATTNNKGEFHFITIFPSATLHERSNVNIRVEHRDLNQLQTKLYLLTNNIDANEYAQINPAVTIVQNKIQIYNFDVVLTGKTCKRYYSIKRPT